jgi:hypothetical protein
VETSEVDEAEEVLDVVFPSGNEAAEVVHPGEEPLHLPAFSIAAELPAILSSAFPPPPIGRNQFNSILLSELRVEPVRVVRFVTDEPGGEFVEKASGKNFLNKLALGRRSALDRYGERKTVISGDSDDLRAFAATGILVKVYSNKTRQRTAGTPGGCCVSRLKPSCAVASAFSTCPSSKYATRWPTKSTSPTIATPSCRTAFPVSSSLLRDSTASRGSRE